MKIRQFAVAVLLLAMAACASNPKARVVTTYQSVEIGLGALQDAYRAAYASGQIPGLTKEQHETVISPAFAKAFDTQIKVGNALLVWKPGTALPVGYDQWVASIENVADVLKVVSPKNKAVFDAAVQFVRSAVAAIKQFGQQPSAALLAAANQ